METTLPEPSPLAFVRPFRLTSQAPRENSPCSYWFVFLGDELLLADHGDTPAIPCTAQLPVPASIVTSKRFIGIYDGIPCITLTVDAEPDGFMNVMLRKSRSYIDNDLWIIAGRASQILQWQRDNVFCGRCGTAMEEKSGELTMDCPQCGFSSYPRVSPAVIMSVIRDGTILLGRAPRFPGGMYSTLAGFVEPGETLEEAVRREVLEETGIEVADIRYVASQAWPFPHSIMIGFTARYAGGELRIDPEELEDAGWFSPDNMPPLPAKLSIARRLIDLYLEEQS